MATVSSEILKEIVDRLVQGLQSERIYLFGSQARGQADEGSDKALHDLQSAEWLLGSVIATAQKTCDRIITES